MLNFQSGNSYVFGLVRLSQANDFFSRVSAKAFFGFIFRAKREKKLGLFFCGEPSKAWNFLFGTISASSRSDLRFLPEQPEQPEENCNNLAENGPIPRNLLISANLKTGTLGSS